MTAMETAVVFAGILAMSMGWSFAFYKAATYKPISEEEIVEIDEII